MSHKALRLTVSFSFLLIVLTACSNATAIPATPTATAIPAIEKASYGPQETDGRKTSLLCIGSGTPTILWDYPFAPESSDWDSYVEKLARTTRVCAVNRVFWTPGKAANKPSAQDLVSDLHTILAQSKIAAPYVLVGYHSGGLITRLYAGQYPEDVVGMVLLMSWHPDQEARLETALSSNDSGAQSTPDPQEDVLTFLYQTDKYALQGMDLGAGFDQVSQVDDLGTIPLQVLTANFSDLVPNLSIVKAWDGMQQDLAGLSTQGKLVTVPKVGMLLTRYNEIPQQVSDAINQVVEEARAIQP